MRQKKASEDDGRRTVIANFTRGDLERLNRLEHARNLRAIIKSTKWLNDHGVELMRQYPLDFCDGTGMTIGQYLQALTVHVDRCRVLLNKMKELKGAGLMPKKALGEVRRPAAT